MNSSIQMHRYHVEGYSDGYWNRLSEAGLSDHKLALIETVYEFASEHKKCLALASSLNEMKMKCTILGFEIGKLIYDDGTLMTYEVREIS